jgi:hypothetical protein
MYLHNTNTVSAETANTTLLFIHVLQSPRLLPPAFLHLDLHIQKFGRNNENYV